MADLNGAGGAKTLAFDFFGDTSIENFGAFGTGGSPADPSELDTLAFGREHQLARNLILDQLGANVVVRFAGDEPGAGQITLENITIEQLENIAGVGNFRFFGEAAVTDSLDIWSATEDRSVVTRPGTVSFLNELDNDTVGWPGAHDVINGLGGSDTLNGLTGDDLLRGGEANDHLIGHKGNDQLFGEDGDDRLDGGRGNDLLDGGAGNDLMTGGKGDDTYVVDSVGDVIVEAIRNSRGGGWADEVLSAISFSLAPYANIENLTLTGEGDLDGTGNARNNVIIGNAGDNVLRGGLGDDRLEGGGGADSLDAGGGNDTIVLAAGGLVNANGGDGIDTVAVNDFGPMLDFTGGLQNSFQSVEILDADQFIQNEITLTAASIVDMTGSIGGAFGAGTLLIKADEGDFIIFSDQGWVEGEAVTDPFGQSGTYASWTNGAATALIATAATALVVPHVDLAHFSPEKGFTIEGASGVGSAGDVNADGIEDFIVNADKSYVIFGQADGLDEVDLTALTPAQGFVVSRSGSPGDEGGPGGGASGDFNGDGIDDLIFGAALADTGGGVDSGQAYVVFGAVGGPGDVDVTTMSAAQGFRISGAAAGDQAGGAASSAGDFNDDGIDDIIIGSREADPLGRHFAGEGYLIYGKLDGLADLDLAALTPDRGFRLAGVGTFDYLGHAATSAGDINGDGLDDFVIGAPFTGDGFGRAYVIYGKANGSFDIDLATFSPLEGFTLSVNDDDLLGAAVSSAGDINGDGIGDLAVSAERTGAGMVYVVYGKEGGLGDIDLTAMTNEQGFRLGYGDFDHQADLGRSVSSAGDVNGDGIDDIVLGAPLLDVATRHEAGQAFVIYGKEGGYGDIDLRNLTEEQGFAIWGAAAYDGTGHDVSAADVNGDGFTDVLVGGNGAHVIYGGDTGAVTHPGTSGDDALFGTAADEVFVGGLGNDVLKGGGGVDAFQGAAGDDTIHVSDGSFKRVDGGLGSDVLHLDFDGLIDLGNIDGDAATSDHTKIRGIETIDADNGFANQIAVHLADVLELNVGNSDVGGVAGLDNVLKIEGDAGDSLSLSDEGWGAADTSTLPGYAIYAVDNVKIAVDQDIPVVQ